jgi:hypothetical protein
LAVTRVFRAEDGGTRARLEASPHFIEGRMLTAMMALLLQSQSQNDLDADAVDPVKEHPKILAEAKGKAAAAVTYKAICAVIKTDSVKDVSETSSGTLLFRYIPADPKKKKPADWAFALDDQGVMAQEATAYRAFVTPARLLTLWTASKEGEEVDLAKDKTLRPWLILATPFSDLLKDYDAKIVMLASKYVLARTKKSSQGGDTNPDAEKQAAAKPGFEGVRSHMYHLVPKNASVASQCKKITVSVDMEHFLVMRVEFDWNGDGTQKSAVQLREVEIGAKVEDAAFQPDTKGFTVRKK